MDALTIGELARRTGVATSALRYYEDLGLMPAPTRRSGQRRYPESAVRVVGMILLLRDLGFSLTECKDVLASQLHATPDWRDLAKRQLGVLEERIAKARAAQEAIEHGLRCSYVPITDCPNFGAILDARLTGLSLEEAHVR